MGRRRRTPHPARHPETADATPLTTGYCLLRDVVDQPTLARLRAEIERLMAARDPALGIEVRAGTEWIRDLSKAVPEIDHLAADVRIRAAVEALLGPGAALQHVRLRNPIGPSAQQSLHVDAAGPVAPGQDQLAQVLLFLDDVDEGNGPTSVVPGSHRSGQVPLREYADPRHRHPNELALTCRAGDAVVFSSHLWHRGTANPSGRPRRALTYSFSRR